MGLVLKLLQLTFGFLLRLGLVVAALFALHLILTRFWPQVRQTAELLDERPLLDERVREAESELELSKRRASELEQELEQRSQAELSALRGEVDGLQQELRELGKRKQNALDQIREANSVVDEYCDTYNPFKLWFCRDMKRRAEQLEGQLSEVVESVEAEAEHAEQRLSTLKTQLEQIAKDPAARLRVLNQRAPNETKKLLSAIEQAKRTREAAANTLDRLRKRQRVAQTVEQSTLGWLVREWRQAWPRLVVLALTVLLLPFAQRALWYFALMPLVARAHPIELSATSDGSLSTGEAARSLRVELQPGEVLYTRPSYARPVEGAASSKLLYRYRAPFISYAAGLVMLTALRGKAGSTTSATLSAPDDPNSYLMRLELANHPGVVIHPRYLVGVIGDLQLETRWRAFSLHSWSTWQLRYILLAGTGSLIIEGAGDVVCEQLEDSRAKIEQNLVLGFDTRLSYRTSRTETFLPYLFGKAPLVDDVFEKTGAYFWQKSVERPAKNPIERSFDALFSAIGKLLGF